MLVLLISIAWLAVIGLIVAVCRMASRGDREFSPSAARNAGPALRKPMGRSRGPGVPNRRFRTPGSQPANPARGSRGNR